VGDMRTQRWVEHRAQTRDRYIDSAMRTIDELGPHVSMREIAADAKIPKPTLYRFFTDKSALASAIRDRIRGTVNETFMAALQRPGTTGGQFVREVLHSYLDAVLKRPNIFRFVVLTMSESSGSTGQPQPGSTATQNIASVLGPLMTSLGGTATNIELDSRMIVGTVISAADWWLHNARQDAPPEHFVDHVEKYIRAMLLASAEANGVALNFDAPIAEMIVGKGRQSRVVMP
jgi:AcrR family transcriptional regulator